METEMDHIISTDGTVIGYRRAGSGPPLILVHGVTADHHSWEAISPALAQHFTLYAMDRRGRGSSGDAPEYDLLREAEDVAALVEAAGTPAAVFGHSYGGLLCLEAALLTGKIQRLLLYEPAVPGAVRAAPPEDALERIQALIDQGALEEAMLTFLREVALMTGQELEIYRQSPVWAARIPLARTIPREMQVLQTYHFDPKRFANLRVPALLLLGGDSPAASRQEIETLAAALPNHQVAVLPGQQHQAHRTDPDGFASVLLNFLQA